MLSDEERLAFLREVEADAELKKQFVAFQNAYALFNLGVQFQDKTLGQQKYNAFVVNKRKSAYRQQVRTCCRYATSAHLLPICRGYFAINRFFERVDLLGNAVG